MNVLVVEDNRRLSGVLRQSLVEDGHQVTIAERGDEGRDLLLGAPFHVAVLDVMLPGLDGFSLLKEARSSRCVVPILMLTAKDSMPDIVHGLNLGADDYLTKPFQIPVFLARVRAMGRRRPELQSNIISVGNLHLDSDSHTVRRDDNEITLTRKEYALLELLMRRANKVVTRNQLREAGWSFDADVSDGNVDFYIHSLRSKIDIKGEESMIRTARSLGYMLTSSR
ncbi:response regulator transcription factor [Terriglobus albidus]|uniref:Response regulator transcription factor n=1 Tax=Terriglobus albidus TaxID=1592106 RepID=A0A5B9EEZ8_9BACT|nr:response regulator transcription factor [Terriglobus albidus]QEE30773.1 response regulator transcription factor [Terriglobus albidus]